ncbi:ABC transporter permease [uncultured Schumannella sp.]|uniref:ABC transporter permease n=1 Tax=uncultured Schumannella sp. TaxID=1195956 RepID=UPI0025FE9193|nr:ABC transporter permease [uncultured Schumannella sp.]
MTTATEQAIAAAVKPRRFGAWYIAEHKLRAMRAYRWTILATGIGTPLFYVFAFGVGLAVLVGANAGPSGIDGVSYLVFVAPALMAMAAVPVALEEFMFGIFLGFKWNPIFAGMNAAPITGRQIIDGMFIFVTIRLAMTSTLYYLVLLLFGAVQLGWSVLIIPVAMLTGLAFSPIAALTASFREDRSQFAIIQRVVIMPLTLFSGTVFPLTQLPIFLQWIGWLSPLWHGSELGRELSYGPNEPIWLTVTHVTFLAAVAIAGWQACVRISVRRLDR